MEQDLIDDMVLFLDTLMLRVDHEIGKLDKNERREVILRFFQNVGLIERTKCKQSGDVLKIAGKLNEVMERGIRGGHDYLSMALGCVSNRGGYSVGDKWYYFASSLAAVFSCENEFFFRRLLAEKDIIYIFDPTSFLFDSLVESFSLTNVERCADHYLSQTKRD
jgi:hypothetical protein